MATTAKPRTTKPRSTKPRTRKPKAEPSTPESQSDLPLEAGGGAAASESKPTLAQTLELTTLFREDGVFTEREVFKYNKVFGGALVKRRAIFTKIATASKDEIMALSRPARNAIFSLIKGETARYYGTATRAVDSAFGKRGDPLPQLTFPDKDGIHSKVEAMSYRALMQRAMDNMRKAVFGEAAVEAPAAAAAA